jgi:hypothetical protein
LFYVIDRPDTITIGGIAVEKWGKMVTLYGGKMGKILTLYGGHVPASTCANNCTDPLRDGLLGFMYSGHPNSINEEPCFASPEDKSGGGQSHFGAYLDPCHVLPPFARNWDERRGSFLL